MRCGAKHDVNHNISRIQFFIALSQPLVVLNPPRNVKHDSQVSLWNFYQPAYRVSPQHLRIARSRSVLQQWWIIFICRGCWCTSLGLWVQFGTTDRYRCGVSCFHGAEHLAACDTSDTPGCVRVDSCHLPRSRRTQTGLFSSLVVLFCVVACFFFLFARRVSVKFLVG